MTKIYITSFSQFWNSLLHICPALLHSPWNSFAYSRYACHYVVMTMPRSTSVVNNDPEDKPSVFRNVSKKASAYHSRVPYLRKIPFSAIAIIITLIAINLLVWAAVGIVLVCISALFRLINQRQLMLLDSIGILLSSPQSSCPTPWDFVMP